MGSIVEKIIEPVVKVFSKALSWLIPEVDIPDFGINEADDFEQGVLLNKQSNDANIPVVYGERLVGGTRVFIETSGSSVNPAPQSMTLILISCPSLHSTISAFAPLEGSIFTVSLQQSNPKPGFSIIISSRHTITG